MQERARENQVSSQYCELSGLALSCAQHSLRETAFYEDTVYT